MLTEEPGLAHFAEDNDSIVTPDGSKTGFVVTVWPKQSDGEMKPITFGSKILKDTGKTTQSEIQNC